MGAQHQSLSPRSSILALKATLFFVEELYRHLLDTGRLLDADGQFSPSLPAQDLDVPGSVRIVIARRIVRIEVKTREVLVTAAVLGGSFTPGVKAETSQPEFTKMVVSLHSRKAK